MSQQEVERYALEMYGRVNALWSKRGREILQGSCGFSILSGPPIDRPELMIIGENPGFGAGDYRAHVEEHWLSKSHIGSATWPLAIKLRKIFAGDVLSSVLEGAMQSNFNFFKSCSIKRASRYRWNDLPAVLRKELKTFCLGELAGYIRVSQPSAIIVLGIDTFDQHATYPTKLLADRSDKRRLMMKGLIFGIPACGILHPSGAHVASGDWARVSAELLNIFRAA